MDTDDMARTGICPLCGRKLTAMADEGLCCPCGWYEGIEDEDNEEQEDGE
jgi:hypothetical protein